jgi:hypothetical protein
MTASAEYTRANDESRTRLRAIISRLDRGRLATNVMEGWSASALLAHLAFWDRFTLLRWQSRLAGNVVPDIGPLADALNDAAVPMWSAVPPEVATREAAAAAEAVDSFVAALAPDVIAEVLAEGRSRWIARSEHRREHLEQIERALAR